MTRGDIKVFGGGLGDAFFKKGPPALRVRDYIELLVCAHEIMDADKDPLKTFEAYDHLARTIAAMTDRPKRCLKALSEMPLQEVFALALDISNELLKKSEEPEKCEGSEGGEECEGNASGDAEDDKSAKPLKNTPRVSREELEVPVYKMALVMRVSVDEIMELPFDEFVRRERVLAAAMVDLKFELMELLDWPHLLEKGRKKISYRLRQVRRGIMPKDASPWVEHMKDARKLLKG